MCQFLVSVSKESSSTAEVLESISRSVRVKPENLRLAEVRHFKMSFNSVVERRESRIIPQTFRGDFLKDTFSLPPISGGKEPLPANVPAYPLPGHSVLLWHVILFWGAFQRPGQRESGIVQSAAGINLVFTFWKPVKYVITNILTALCLLCRNFRSPISPSPNVLPAWSLRCLKKTNWSVALAAIALATAISEFSKTCFFQL